MSEGGRESGNKPAVVYFPSGKYVISDTIDIYSTTQVIGDYAAMPELLITEDFNGFSVFNTVGGKLAFHETMVQLLISCSELAWSASFVDGEYGGCQPLEGAQWYHVARWEGKWHSSCCVDGSYRVSAWCLYVACIRISWGITNMSS